MLKLQIPDPTRRRWGIGVCSGLASLIGAAAWAAQGKVATPAAGLPIAIHFSWSVTRLELDNQSHMVSTVHRSTGDIVSRVGSEFVTWMPKPDPKEYLMTCNTGIAAPSQPAASSASPDQPLPKHNISVHCEFSVQGQVVAKPTIVTKEDQMFNIDVLGDKPASSDATSDAPVDFRVTMLVSTDPSQVAATGANQRDPGTP